MKKNAFFVFFWTIFLSHAFATDLTVQTKNGHYVPTIVENGTVLLAPPNEGLWSVSTWWKEDWCTDWAHASADSIATSGEWTLLYGTISLPAGEWKTRDAYRKEGTRVKCVRRFEWHGTETLPYVTLSARWELPAYTDRILMPGILYYGNPSGYRNGRNNMPTFGKEEAPEAIFEEHRFSMPFVSAEVETNGRLFGVALHTLPTQVPYGNRKDQWWSLGATARDNTTEITLLSGPVAWNKHRSAVKALQTQPLPYGDTYMNVKPGAVIEKTFYLETYPIDRPGTGFMTPINTSLDLFRPFYADDMPAFEKIVKTKYDFALSRWHEEGDIAGFCMFPKDWGPQFVMGWCGQGASLGYALQRLQPLLQDSTIPVKVQKSLDLLAESPFNENGFLLNYIARDNKWERQDNVSQGQAMYNFAKAVEAGRKNKRVDTQKWEEFLQRACDLHARRILDDSWNPVSTNEGFYIAPLAIASKLFKNKTYLEAAVKATEHYAERHLSMQEPYWGGTLDASGEDKEGAWAAFQGFLTLYEMTKDKKYLQYAEHAAYVTLSYTVVWDIPMPASRMGDHYFKSRGWTVVSPQNQHLDVYGVLYAPEIYKLGTYLNREDFKKLAILMYRTCGQMIDPFGSHGEQLQQTNYAQDGSRRDLDNFRGGYAEHWTVFWVTAHFLNAAARFMEMGIIP